MSSNRIFKNPILILGALILLAQIGVSWMSRSFVFGTGHAERPIIPFLILEFATFGFYFIGLELVRRLPREFGSNSKTVFWIILIGILCRLVFLPSNLIQETDPYRYIWDGQSVLRGTNPYEHSPKDAFRNQLPPAENSEPEMAETFPKINHAGVKTIYPPLAQFLFAASQWISPWNVAGWKFMVLMAEAGILLLLALIFRRLGLRFEWLMLYAWSPLALKEFSNSLHVDVFAILFLCGMMLAIAHQRIILSYIFLALSTLTKFFPLVLLPVLFAWTYRQKKRESFAGLAAFVGIAGLFYLPFMSVGPQLFEGLGRFAGEWRVNEGLFGVIRSALMLSGIQSLQAEMVSRSVSGAGVLMAIYFSIHWIWTNHDSIDLFKACVAVLAVLFFLAPTGNPWYFTWVLPFLAFLPLRSLALFSGLVFLYYLDFYFAYQGTPQLFTRARLIEYGIFYLFLGWELWKIKSPLFYRSQTKELLSATR